MTIRTVANEQTYGNILSKKGQNFVTFLFEKKELSKKKSVGFWQIFTQKNDSYLHAVFFFGW